MINKTICRAVLLDHSVKESSWILLENKNAMEPEGDDINCNWHAQNDPQRGSVRELE